MLRIAAQAASLLLVLGLAGCTGSEGDPCQEEDDCNSGLMCCKTSSSLSARGTCESMCVDTGRDAGPPPADSGPPADAGMDAGTAGDAGTDAGTAEDAGTDAGTDAGSDAGTDAGTDGG